MNERRVFFEGVQFYLSDHYPLLGFLDVHPCYGGAWRAGQAAARAGRGHLMQLRDQAIVLNSRHAKEMLRLGQEELLFSRQQAVMRDVSAFQSGQAKAERRRREVRAIAHSKAFGPESCFARDNKPVFAIASGSPAAPSNIFILSYDALRQTAWADLLSFLPLKFARRRGENTCYVNNVAHVVLRVPAMGAWLEKHLDICLQQEGCLLCVLAATRKQLSDKQVRNSLPKLAVCRGLVRNDFRGNRQ